MEFFIGNFFRRKKLHPIFFLRRRAIPPKTKIN
ncbi:hypothetical protein P775_00275 [Puniceibacterium antarcticum]|uniref:Uncharacterized protein n=1 Tax=Puniceibacterium antarcticum TaxID=1206336 RepID=A0A2G8RL57_9RHOB|nr:hypothetical protein P775_00275 [Puniceibacterium antarcticum]